MRRAKLLWRWLLILSMLLGLVIVGTALINPQSVRAATPTPVVPPGPDRYASMQVDVTLYEWWLSAWRDNNVYCSFYVDHEGLPNSTDIISACGVELYNAWQINSNPCSEEIISACPGYYFILVSSKPGTRDVTVKLPAPQVWITMDGCQPDDLGWCTQQPSLVLTAEEPLPNESITAINGFAGTDPFTCQGGSCTFKLSATRPEGIHLTFWADSSLGDSSLAFDAVLRVIDDGNQPERLTSRWYVDVLSSQWKGGLPASCAAVWESFPPVDGLPEWLTTPASSLDLRTNIPYDYLAANLITQAVVDASACPGGGLLPDGSANVCGLDAASPAVQEWQNRFDSLIFSVAQDTKVPAQMLKNLFSRESQFWPGVFRNSKDVGLGQLTEGGADTALLWNPSFYNQFCPLILDQGLCESTGFANLKPDKQSLLRGALVSSVDARCDECPLGLDLSRADFSVGVFARTMLANCEQAGKIVNDVTGKMPGLTVDYETLWRFTLINYNAGSGCLAGAINAAYNPTAEIPLNWDAVAGVLETTCPGAVNYVADVSRTAEPDLPPPTSTPQPENKNGQKLVCSCPQIAHR